MKISHKKFDLHIWGLKIPGREYEAFIITKNGVKLDINKTPPRNTVSPKEVQKYYLIHAKEVYFRYRDRLRANRNGETK